MKSLLQIAERRGIILPLAAIMMTVVMIFTAFVTDYGIILIQKTELQAAVDAATLAGVLDVTVDEATVEATVDEYLLDNGFDVNDAAITRTLEYGTWDPDTGAFTVQTIGNVHAIRVKVVTNDVPAFFGSIMGYSHHTTSAQSIAAQTFGPPRDIVIVLDCSTSMDASMSNGLSRIENTKTAAQVLVNTLNDNDRVSLAVYSWWDAMRDTDDDDDECEKTGKVETGLNFNRQPTYDFISLLSDGFYTSGTNIGGGYRAGLDAFLFDPAPRDATEPELVKILVMMTDGEVNKPEPYPSPDPGPTGVLPPGPYNSSDYVDHQAMRYWADTIKARGIKVYTVKLHGSFGGTFMQTASDPDDYDDQYYFHIDEGDEDVSMLMEIYKDIGIGLGGPKLVQ